MSASERDSDTHNGSCIVKLFGKVVGAFLQRFFFWFSLLALCSWLQMKRASKTKAHVGYKIAGAQLDFASCQLFGLLSISATTRAPPATPPAPFSLCLDVCKFSVICLERFSCNFQGVAFFALAMANPVKIMCMCVCLLLLRMFATRFCPPPTPSGWQSFPSTGIQLLNASR